jgi:hypothetical protein
MLFIAFRLIHFLSISMLISSQACCHKIDKVVQICLIIIVNIKFSNISPYRWISPFPWVYTAYICHVNKKKGVITKLQNSEQSYKSKNIKVVSYGAILLHKQIRRFI